MKALSCPTCRRPLVVVAPAPSEPTAGLRHIAETVAAVYEMTVDQMRLDHSGARRRGQSALATEARRTAVVLAYEKYKSVPIRALTDLFGYRYEARGAIYDALNRRDRLPLLDELRRAVAA